MNTIKKLMKNVSAAAIAVMLMGGVFAFSTQSNEPEPNMFHNGSEWVPLDPLTEYQCEDSEDKCTGYREDPNDEKEPVIDIESGSFTVL